MLAEGVTVTKILPLWLCVPGAVSVAVPAAEGVTVIRGVVDKLFNTDSEITEDTDGLIL
jgi:hypothetical protein